MGSSGGDASPPRGELKKEDSGILWGLFDGLITPPTTPSGDSLVAVRREASGSGRRKGMPSGVKSMVPEGFKPPHPKHKELFDGKVGQRELHVKNFYRHFCTFQPTPFNDGVVAALEDCGEYKLPVWYSSLISAAAPTILEQKMTYEREELDDGLGGMVAVDWAVPRDFGASYCACVLLTTCLLPLRKLRRDHRSARRARLRADMGGSATPPKSNSVLAHLTHACASRAQ
jgi:hypothetical protein